MDINNFMMTSPRIRLSLGIVCVVAALSGSYFVFHFLSVSHVMGGARGALERGFPALAADMLEKERVSVAKREDGCRLLLDTYFGARKQERLQWAAEACLSSGKEIAEYYLGLALSKEMLGQDADALRILENAARKFDKASGLFLHMAQILRRNKNVEDAAKLYAAAVEKAPDNLQFGLEALQFYIETGKSDLARQLATRLKSVKTENPEVKLVIARGLQRGGDVDGARALAQEAFGLVAANADLKARLEQLYNDVASLADHSKEGRSVSNANPAPAPSAGGSAAPPEPVPTPPSHKTSKRSRK